MFNNINDDLKRVILAGIGAVAITTEKSKLMLDELVKKGQLTVEQGKILNEELKRNMQPQARDNEPKASSFINQLDKMSKEDLAALKARLAEIERTDADGEKDK